MIKPNTKRVGKSTNVKWMITLRYYKPSLYIITRKSGHRCASLTSNTADSLVKLVSLVPQKYLTTSHFVRSFDFHWLSLIIIDYLKTVNCWLTDSVTTWNQGMPVRLKGNQKTENFRLTQIWGQCGSCALLVGQLSQWRNRGRLHNGPTLSLPFSSSAVFLRAENILFVSFKKSTRDGNHKLNFFRFPGRKKNIVCKVPSCCYLLSKLSLFKFLHGK